MSQNVNRNGTDAIVVSFDARKVKSLSKLRKIMRKILRKLKRHA